MTTDGARERRPLREAFQLERPVPTTAAGLRLRRLIALTAVMVVAVEAVNIVATPAPGFALFVRSLWAAARVIGFLLLMRSVRYGRAGARPFGLILAVTTVFAVARLAEPREGSMAFPIAVIVGFVVLVAMCGAIVWQLYRSPAVGLHLSGRQVRRHVPPWVLTVRVAVLAYGALLLVPFFVAVGTVGADDRRLPLSQTLALLAIWLVFGLVVTLMVPLGSFFVLVGHGWARWAVGVLSVVVLIVQPVLCYLVLGFDGLLRDGVPMIITAIIGLVALERSRGLATWVRPVEGRPNNGTATVVNGASDPA